MGGGRYMKIGERISDKLTYFKRDAFACIFMAWAGVSYREKNEIKIIERGTKVNITFYINNVLKLFLAKDVPRLFQRDQKLWCFTSTVRSVKSPKKTTQFH